MAARLWSFLIVLGIASRADALSVQEALLRAKPAVVRIVVEITADVRLDCGAGPKHASPPAFRETATGWVLDPAGWIVTSGHVVQPAQAPPVALRDTAARQAVETACVEPRLAAAPTASEEDVRRRILDAVLPTAQTTLTGSVTVILSNGVRLPAQVAKYGAPPAPMQMSSRDLALLRVTASDLPTLRTATSTRVQIGDPARVLGYPDVVLTHELLKQGTAVEATVTTGTISGFKNDVAGHPVIQTDASATGGSSGGPVLNTIGDVVGVLSFVASSRGSEGTAVQGFNFVIPVGDVLDFARGTGASATGTSKFNELWWAGLADFFQMNYRGAAAKIAAADAVVPDLPDVKRLLAEAKSRPTPLPWATIAAVVTSASTLLYAGLWVRRWRRNRFRISPADTARLLEDAADPPLLLDVRAPAAYAQSPLRIPRSIRVDPEDPTGGGVQIKPDRLVVAYCT